MTIIPEPDWNLTLCQSTHCKITDTWQYRSSHMSPVSEHAGWTPCGQENTTGSTISSWNIKEGKVVDALYLQLMQHKSMS